MDEIKNTKNIDEYILNEQKADEEKRQTIISKMLATNEILTNFDQLKAVTESYINETDKNKKNKLEKLLIACAERKHVPFEELYQVSLSTLETTLTEEARKYKTSVRVKLREWDDSDPYDWSDFDYGTALDIQIGDKKTSLNFYQHKGLSSRKGLHYFSILPLFERKVLIEGVPYAKHMLYEALRAEYNIERTKKLQQAKKQLSEHDDELRILKNPEYIKNRIEKLTSENLALEASCADLESEIENCPL